MYSCHLYTYIRYIGLSIGGVWGLVEGVRSLDGKTGRLRVNSIVNGCTRRGPFLGNSLGVLGGC